MLEKIKSKLKELIVKKSFWVMVTGTITSVIALLAAYNKTATIEQIAAAWVIVKGVLDYLVSKFATDDTIRTINRHLEAFGERVTKTDGNIYRTVKFETYTDPDEEGIKFFQG